MLKNPHLRGVSEIIDDQVGGVSRPQAVPPDWKIINTRAYTSSNPPPEIFNQPDGGRRIEVSYRTVLTAIRQEKPIQLTEGQYRFYFKIQLNLSKNPDQNFRAGFILTSAEKQNWIPIDFDAATNAVQPVLPYFVESGTHEVIVNVEKPIYLFAGVMFFTKWGNTIGSVDLLEVNAEKTDGRYAPHLVIGVPEDPNPEPEEPEEPENPGDRQRHTAIIDSENLKYRYRVTVNNEGNLLIEPLTVDYSEEIRSEIMANIEKIRAML